MDLARIKSNVAKMASMNAPEADIDGYIASEGATIDDVRNFQSSPQESRGFIDNVSGDIKNRVARQNEINNATALKPDENQQNALRGAWQTGTNILGAANDIVGEGIKSLAETGYEKLPQSFRDRQELGLKALANTDKGKAVSELAQKYNQNKEAFKQAYPNWSRDVEGMGDAGAFFMPGGTKDISKAVIKGSKVAAQVGTGVAKKTAQGAMEIGRDVTGIEKPPIIPTIKELGDLSTNLYAQSASEGGILPPEFANQFIKESNTVKPISEKGAAIRGKNPIQDVLDSIDTFKDKPFTMAEIDEVDKELTRKINSFLDGGLATPESRDVQQIQNKFRELVDKTDLPGVQSWKEAKNAFATKKRLEDIQDIFNNAKNRPNEATAIQAGFRRIAEDEGRIRGYSPEARKYIIKAARNNNGIDALKIMGSRLLPIIAGGSGGGVGAVAATAAGGMAARNMAATIKASQGNKVASQITKDFMKKASPKTKADLMAEQLKK